MVVFWWFPPSNVDNHTVFDHQQPASLTPRPSRNSETWESFWESLTLCWDCHKVLLKEAAPEKSCHIWRWGNDGRRLCVGSSHACYATHAKKDPPLPEHIYLAKFCPHLSSKLLAATKAWPFLDSSMATYKWLWSLNATHKQIAEELQAHHHLHT